MTTIKMLKDVKYKKVLKLTKGKVFEINSKTADRFISKGYAEVLERSFFIDKRITF